MNNQSQVNCSAPNAPMHIIVTIGSNSGYRIALITLYILMFIIGVIGNSLVCYVILSKRVATTTTTIFLFNLALVDLILLIVLVPPKIIRQITLGYILGESFCKIESFLANVCLCNASMTLVVVGIDKFIAIADPFKRHYFHKSLAIKILIINWIISLIVMVVPLINNVIEYTYIPSYKTCVGICFGIWRSYDDLYAYYLFVFSFDFFIPLIIIIFIYGSIANYVINTKNMNKYGLIKRIYTKRKRKVMKMLVIVVAAFVICWTPYCIFTLLYLFNVIKESPITIKRINDYFVLLTFCNAMVNPIIYALYHDNFKKGIRSKSHVPSRYYSISRTVSRSHSRTSSFGGSFLTRKEERRRTKAITLHKMSVLQGQGSQYEM